VPRIGAAVGRPVHTTSTSRSANVPLCSTTGHRRP
jgi:hypothetical protein